jgi:hypothetical protein
MLFGVVHSADVTGFVLFVDFSGGARRINIFNCDGFQGQEVLEHVEAFYTRCWVGKQCIHQYILCVFFISSDCTRVQISILNMLSRYTTNTLYLSLFWDSLWQYIYTICVTNGLASLSLQALPDPKADAKTDKSAEAAAFSCGGWIYWGMRHHYHMYHSVSLSSLDITENEALT